MRSRRQFFCLSLAALVTSTIRGALPREQTSSPNQAWLPMVISPPLGDMPILGPASGARQQAVAWLAPRATGYTPYDIETIVAAYMQTGASAGMDWFLALAQLAHETGSLTSWWSQRPRRNPAGIGVTGRTQTGTPDAPPPGAWQWDDQASLWREGLAFATWADHAIPAHLGRLLAYALRDDQANAAQQALIAYALAYRPLPASYRGSAPTIIGLNGRWAVPGADYGQRIIEMVQLMRQP
jgi:hypothetical protein